MMVLLQQRSLGYPEFFQLCLHFNQERREFASLNVVECMVNRKGSIKIEVSY